MAMPSRLWNTAAPLRRQDISRHRCAIISRSERYKKNIVCAVLFELDSGGGRLDSHVTNPIDQLRSELGAFASWRENILSQQNLLLKLGDLDSPFEPLANQVG
jgi:hypothetical protein